MVCVGVAVFKPVKRRMVALHDVCWNVTFKILLSSYEEHYTGKFGLGYMITFTAVFHISV